MLTIATTNDKDITVTVKDAESEDDDSGLPECRLDIGTTIKGVATVGQRAHLNPYEAEAIGNALLRWVKDVTIDADDDEEEDEDDEESD